MRSFRRGRSSRGARYEWTFGGAVAPTTVAVNGLNDFALLTKASMEEFPRALLVRTIATAFVSPATAPAAATGYGVFLGLTKVGFGTGQATYDPELNMDHRWSWWNGCFPQIGGTGAADSNASRWAGYFRFDIDMRMKERFADDEEFHLFVKNSNSSGASIQYSVLFRFLMRVGRK